MGRMTARQIALAGGAALMNPPIPDDSPWDISQLFAAAQGFAYDLMDKSKNFTSVWPGPVLTHPALGGYTLEYSQDQSGTGGYAYSYAATAPTSQTGGGALGSSTKLLNVANNNTGGAVDFSGSHQMTVVASVLCNSATPQYVLEIGNTSGVPGSTAILMLDHGGGVFSLSGRLEGATATPQVYNSLAVPSASWQLLTCLFDFSAASADAAIQVRRNGVLSSNVVEVAGAPGDHAGINGPCKLFNGASGAGLVGQIGRVIAITGTLSGANLTNAEAWVAAGLVAGY